MVICSVKLPRLDLSNVSVGDSLGFSVQLAGDCQHMHTKMCVQPICSHRCVYTHTNLSLCVCVCVCDCVYIYIYRDKRKEIESI